MSKHKSTDYKLTAVWNRDVNGATNIFRIVKNIIEKRERPKYLCR